MRYTSLIPAVSFCLAHILLITPFVPLGALVPVVLGAISLSAMALTLILAARWRIVDRIMGGPDKSYAAHRWLGFFALGGALGHWAIDPAGGAALIPGLSDGAEGAGTLAASGLIVMTATALIRAIPYHLWKASHMLMGPVFVLGVFHTFFVGSSIATGSLPWLVLAGLSGLGLIAWGQTLLRKIAPTRLVTVRDVRPFEGGVDVTFEADRDLPPFRPGQFATLAHNRARAEAHPFTIAGGDDRTRRFVIRAAGDWTETFVRDVAPGQAFRISKGVGRFLPKTSGERPAQLWVAGGVGITPFLAALERMEPDHGPRITLIYCARDRASAGALEDVERHAKRLPQVDLVLCSEAQGTKLTRERLTKILLDKDRKTQVYLCGPEGLKSMVTDIWKALGMTGRIHSERFDFRGAYGLTDLIYIGKPVLNAAGDLAARARKQVHATAGS